MTNSPTVAGSFRDPRGFVFSRNGVTCRQINHAHRRDYNHLTDSGMYDRLIEAGLLIPHTEVDVPPPVPEKAYKVIQPEHVDFISYPYEWCFSQLKDAALATLDIQRRALELGMSLRDASAYNIQYHQGRPVLIDTLSLGLYEEDRPWSAYGQFCRHFLAPLALMCHTDITLNALLRCHIDGIPLQLAAALLPLRSRLRFSLLSHIHLHAKSERRFAGSQQRYRDARMSKKALTNMIIHLEGAIEGLTWKPGGTEWGEYYSDTNYSATARAFKERTIEDYLKTLSPQRVWDLGGNVGDFSRIAARLGASTLSFDIDPAAVETNYLTCRAQKTANILPLLLDLTNPSPGIGWAHEERNSLRDRGPADTIMALALVHHLAISNNVPFASIAAYLRDLGHALIIEFVPKTDSQVQRLLATREDIFDDYTQEAFEHEFSRHFTIEASVGITDSERVLYSMRRRDE